MIDSSSAIDGLLYPISPTSTCGEDMSFSPEFDSIQEMRRADDPTLDQGEWITDLKFSDWPGVAKQSSDLLRSRTKDLRVAAWLAEAWGHLRGFGGLCDGFELVQQICERYWEQVFPVADEGDFEQRSGNLSWLLTQTQLLCRTMPLLQLEGINIGLADIDSARQARTIDTDTAPASGSSSQAPILNMDFIGRAIRDTPSEFILDALNQTKRLRGALDGLQGFIDEKLGDAGPGFVAARKSVDEALFKATAHAKERGLLHSADGEADQDSNNIPMGESRPNAAHSQVAGPLQTRAQAVAQLRAVAEFFRTTEPHSPVAYLAEKAARWGEMPLHTWLRNVVKDEAALAQLEELLGVMPPAPSN